MIKVFRKIRRKLLSENKPNFQTSKFSRYLFYALGEIILVVIGILIAVGINSVYNKSQNEEKINTILKQVQQDLVVDINDAKRIYNFYIDKDSFYRKIMNDSGDYEIFKKNPYPLLITDTYVSFSNKKGGYQHVMDNIENLPEDYIFLLPHFNLLYIEMQNDIDDYNTFIKNTSMIEGQNFTNKYPRFADYQFGRYPEEFQEVFFHDPDLKNVTFNFINDLRNISQAANSYRSESILLYKKIDSLLNNIPKEYDIPLSILPEEENYEPFLGKYKNIVGDVDNEINIVLRKKQLFVEQPLREELKVYWHDGEYYYAGVGVIIRLFSNSNDEHFMEIRSNTERKVYQKI